MKNIFTGRNIANAGYTTGLSRKEIRRIERDSRRDIGIGAVIIQKDGTMDSPRLQRMMDDVVKEKGKLFYECVTRTAESRRKIPGDPDAVENLKERAAAFSKTLNEINVQSPSDIHSLSPEEKDEIRGSRSKHAAAASALASAQGELKRVEQDIEEALKDIRQIVSETAHKVLNAETLGHERMNTYITAASREAGTAFVILDTRESLFSKIVEDLYQHLNKNDPSLRLDTVA
jgi:hypothetical protein